MRINSLRWWGVILLAVVLIGPLPATVGAADIVPPHAFYGTLTHSDGSPAAAGVTVTATVNGEEGGSLTTTQNGQYGNAYKGYPKLIVQGDFVDGDPVKFFVNGAATSFNLNGVKKTSYPFSSGGITNLDLVYTPPTHQFYGNITRTTGGAAPAGVIVSAVINGQTYASLTTTESGQYGGSGEGDPKLTIQDDIEDGAIISFFINGVPASPTYTFQKGSVTNLNLSYTPPIHRFYGNITRIGGGEAPAGVIVSAVINGQTYASLTTTETGQYGGSGEGDPKLTIQDDIADGETISFYINGAPATPTYTFKNGSLTNLNLSYTPPAHQFYGSITRTTGGQAATGVTVYAKINGQIYASLVTTETGQYGGSGSSSPKLTIQDDIENGAVITFYVNDCEASPTFTFTGGGITQLNLIYTPPIHQFYGNITRTTGGQTPAGVTVSAEIDGQIFASLVTTQAGQYGGSDEGDPKLTIQDDIADGETISFYINGAPATPTYTFKNGSLTNLNLSYTPPAHQFYGSITRTTGGQAAAGVTVYAKINGQIYASLITTEAGKFGGSSTGDPKLTIQDDISDGAVITFYVNDSAASPTFTYSGEGITELDLTYTPPIHKFYGNITRTTTGQSPAGVTVYAKINGKVYASLITTVVGQYGAAGAGDPKLTIQDDILKGAAITFYVNDRPASPGFTFSDGSVTKLDLSYTPPAHKFYGTLIRTSGSNAPAGVTVYAKINGTVYASLTTTAAGKYGGAGAGDAKLTVQDDLAEGTPITFYINNYPAKQSATFSGDQTTELNLTYTQPSGGGFSGDETPTPATTTTTTPVSNIQYVEIEVNGRSAISPLSENGLIQEHLTIQSPDQKIQLDIPSGTAVSGPSGILTLITVHLAASPPAAPAGTVFMGPVYQCEPDGAAFNPPVTLSLIYDLPAAYKSADLQIGWYSSSGWTILNPSQYHLDEATHTIRITVTHFSYYAVLAPGSVAATTTSKTTSAAATTTLATTQSTTPTASITPITTTTATAASTPAVPVESQFKWWIMLIIAAIVIVALVIIILVRRKQSIH